jgi:hypothetical protein
VAALRNAGSTHQQGAGISQTLSLPFIQNEQMLTLKMADAHGADRNNASVLPRAGEETGKRLLRSQGWLVPEA